MKNEFIPLFFFSFFFFDSLLKYAIGSYFPYQSVLYFQAVTVVLAFLLKCMRKEPHCI